MNLIFKKLHALVIFAASSSLVRKAARLIFKLAPRTDIAVRSPEGILYADSPDRLLAALLWKKTMPSSLEYSVYARFIRPGMTVLDIGANIGFFTLLFSRLAGETGRVIAFEPDPDNFRLLRKTLDANNRKNVECEQKAVSEGDGAEKLFLSEEHRGDHRIFDSGDDRKSININTISVDGKLGPQGRADFIKMDIQGAEFRALAGMERTIRNSPGLTMLCEFSPALLKKAGAGPGAFLEKLLSYGFTMKYLDEETCSVKEASPEELTALCAGEKYLNLLLERT
ncbi:MAG: hypothetical protein A2X28_11350 [Elusimicrobia bacterium GWA2_56_46]|nr:MAG: hypothetical protein A2X28_11350 [Elusimicrobia bacterium GWA2_56_46]OGR54533.1 MAG: hypothetical protein A2X39_10135 [Elusimicrobia bacterium GWC2_56_31]HBB68204.1 hypothetical protein [Elusimicrobiota bacterium]HBW22335.1 hypothetical protein [Elusimicrobiota bacterium]